MSQIQTEEVKRIAEIAKIAITEEQAETYTAQINRVIVLADQLNEVNTTDVQPTIHVMNTRNVQREGDQPSTGLAIEDIIRNAPDHQDGQIRVPSILE